MRIKRLELSVEYDENSIRAFHTDLESNLDPPTIIVIDGRECEGYVSFREIDGTYEIIITPARNF